MFDQPWYAIIGPPGAGKTTALLNAGLPFTLAGPMGQAAVAGGGGTRLCDWWFTQDAVLIDTAGRYTTQDSDAAVDRAGWNAFLALLKRTRPRQPLNGVIVAIALTDIVQAHPAERDTHAATIARRIAELEHSFGMRLPVYALFTKADLIAGFSEFFDGLTREQRDQVWGQTFALGVQGPAVPERFTAGFRALVDRLNERLAARLQAEHRLDRRGLIAGFPSQVASLEKPLAAFIAAAFTTGAPSPAARRLPHLRHAGGHAHRPPGRRDCAGVRHRPGARRRAAARAGAQLLPGPPVARRDLWRGDAGARGAHRRPPPPGAARRGVRVRASGGIGHGCRDDHQPRCGAAADPIRRGRARRVSAGGPGRGARPGGRRRSAPTGGAARPGPGARRTGPACTGGLRPGAGWQTGGRRPRGLPQRPDQWLAAPPRLAAGDADARQPQPARCAV